MTNDDKFSAKPGDWEFTTLPSAKRAAKQPKIKGTTRDRIADWKPASKPSYKR